jgi:hypothetical protein
MTQFISHRLAGENLDGSTVTTRVCLMGANLIDAGGLRIEINQRPPAEVVRRPLPGAILIPPALLGIADF